MSEKTELLAAAGFPVQSASPEQVAVLESLSADELRVLQNVKSRIDAAASDVQGHDAIGSSGGYFW